MAKATQTAEQKEQQGKVQALDRALSQIDKMFGSGSIMRLDSNASHTIPGISTGTLSLDLALGGTRRAARPAWSRSTAPSRRARRPSR